MTDQKTAYKPLGDYCCYGEGCETCRPDDRSRADVPPQNCGYPGCPAEAGDQLGHAHG